MLSAIRPIIRVASEYFAFWVLIISIIAYFFPGGFLWVKPWITPLLGVVMFGMGLTLTVQDFALIFRRPKPVLIGVAAQFLIMPAAAFLIAKGMGLPPQLAVGLVLVGACPGGTASNVIVYMSRGDVPLSVTMTTVSTLLAPVLTPLLLLGLAGAWLPVNPWELMTSILQVIILPVTLGLLVQRFFPGMVRWSTPALPLVSVTAIVIIVAGIIALNAEEFTASAAPVIAAVILHNGMGLLLGYWAAKWTGLPIPQRRAVSIEVGMQNSGLGVALAVAHFHPIAALPGAIFSVWHNISGPALATWWARKKTGADSMRSHPEPTRVQEPLP